MILAIKQAEALEKKTRIMDDQAKFRLWLYFRNPHKRTWRRPSSSLTSTSCSGASEEMEELGKSIDNIYLRDLSMVSHSTKKKNRRFTIPSPLTHNIQKSGKER